MRESALSANATHGVTRWADVDFTGGKLSGAFFWDGRLERCTFAAPGLANLEIRRTSLVDCVFSGRVKGLSIDQRVFEAGQLRPETRGLDLSRAEFDGIDLNGLLADEVLLPDSELVLVARGLPKVALEALERLSQDESVAAKRVKAVVKASIDAGHNAGTDLLLNIGDLMRTPDDPVLDAYRRAFPRELGQVHSDSAGH